MYEKETTGERIGRMVKCGVVAAVLAFAGGWLQSCGYLVPGLACQAFAFVAGVVAICD